MIAKVPYSLLSQTQSQRDDEDDESARIHATNPPENPWHPCSLHAPSAQGSFSQPTMDEMLPLAV